MAKLEEKALIDLYDAYNHVKAYAAGKEGAPAIPTKLEDSEFNATVNDAARTVKKLLFMLVEHKSADARRKLADLLDQVAHRAAEAVEFPDHQRVAGAQIGERFG